MKYMIHNHSHSSKHSHKHSDTENLGIAFWMNFLFTLLEIVGGILTNSVAIISDALHDLGDSLSLGISWVLAKISQKEKTTTFTYGYKRFSLLAAVINGVVIVGGAVAVLVIAIPRLFNPVLPNAKGMFVLAIIGILVNGYAGYRLKCGKTYNERMVSWHFFEDLFGWVAVLLASVVMIFWEIPILDPILSIVFTFYILFHVVKELRGVVMVFLQGVPAHLNVKNIENNLKKLEGINGVHDTHVWSLDGESHILTTHAVICKDCTADDAVAMKCKVKDEAKRMGLKFVTVEIEYDSEKCDLT